MKLRKLLITAGIIGASLLPMRASAQNNGWLARTEVKTSDNGIIHQPQVKFQNYDRRAQTQFYLGSKANSLGTQSVQFSINPLIRRPNLDGAVSFFGELNDQASNKYGLETGFDIGDMSFYLGHSRKQDLNMTAGKIGKRFGKQKIALGVSYIDNESTNDEMLFYTFLRTTLKDALEINSRLDFKEGGLEEAIIISQFNATGDGLLPGARYVGRFTPEQDKHSFRIGFGRNRKLSYGSVDGATDFFFIPLNMINPAFLNYGNGTLPHGYGEYVINGFFINSKEVGKDRFVVDFYKNFYNAFGIDNSHLVMGLDKQENKIGYSVGLGIQEGTFYGSLRLRFSPDGKIEPSVRLDKAIRIPKEKMLLEL